ncbi:acyl carrier protein [Shimia isoporae]|uniref:Acyl carrier protein n=1 Tax=Shimia isoporae TaxID=647720 RepID=A0A4V6NFR7_9RHOB|nr:acyl carrier protein [Shimia isoporae]TCL08290.1 acyl carrier protein [Shimia isoporae]
MSLQKIKSITADILFLDDPSEIEGSKPFEDIGFTSIDFIDLCYELQQQIDSRIKPEELWPINQFATDPALFADGKWTDAGWARVQEALEFKDSSQKLPSELTRFWTPAFCAKRVEAVINA